MNKPTKVQLTVIDLMQKGWQLGWSMSFDSRAWLQKGGIGRGGDCKYVSQSTVLSLWRKGLIEKDEEKYPTKTFKLTEKRQ